MNKCVYALACICVSSVNAYVCERGCCLNSEYDNPPFVQQLSLFSPKIGCTSFVTSHECLLNLLWRDLDVNLFPVEKAKLWNHKPKNKTFVRFFKAFYGTGLQCRSANKHACCAYKKGAEVSEHGLGIPLSNTSTPLFSHFYHFCTGSSCRYENKLSL